MHWQRKRVSAHKVEPYYLRPGIAPPLPLPLPRERAWGSNPKPLPCLETRPDCPCPWIQPNPQISVTLAPVVSQLSLPVCGQGALPNSPHLPRVLPVGDVDPELENWVGRWGGTCPCLGILKGFFLLGHFCAGFSGLFVAPESSGHPQKALEWLETLDKICNCASKAKFSAKIEGCGLFFPRPG